MLFLPKTITYQIQHSRKACHSEISLIYQLVVHASAGRRIDDRVPHRRPRAASTTARRRTVIHRSHATIDWDVVYAELKVLLELSENPEHEYRLREIVREES